MKNKSDRILEKIVRDWIIRFWENSTEQGIIKEGCFEMNNMNACSYVIRVNDSSKKNTPQYRTEYNLQTVGRNLRRCRERKHLSVMEVKEYLRIGTVQAIYKWEEGICYPQADNLLALMELYEAEVGDIVSGTWDGKDEFTMIECCNVEEFGKSSLKIVKWYCDRYISLQVE